MSSKSHWVTELFPPTFRFTLDELEKFPVRDARRDDDDDDDEKDDDDGTPGKQREDTKPLTEFEKRIAHHIAPEDIAAIKNVYQRVWLMNRMKGKEPEQLLNETGDELYKDAQTCTSDLAAHWDADDDVIWSTSEIGVLRQVFREAQKQNTALTARVQGHDAEYQRLKSKQQAQEADLRTTSSQLHEVRKANKRLQILNANLKKTLDQTNQQVQLLEQDILSLQQDRKEKSAVIHQQNIALDKARIARGKLEQDLRHKDSEALTKMKLHEDKLEIIHQTEIKKLKSTIKKLHEALEDEVKDHERTKKGLTVLRNHFTSLPYAGEQERKQMVVEDELVTWTQ